jgi:hypothetical protein
VSTIDPADRRLTKTPPQPHFGMRPANPKFSRALQTQDSRTMHLNNITSATIVCYTIVVQLQLLLVNIAMDNVIDQF